MKLFELRKLNPDVDIKEIQDPSFKKYGQIIDVKMNDIIKAVDHLVQIPVNGNRYVASDEKLESEAKIQALSEQIYGYLPVMAGVVCGRNDVLNGIEYHQCSETIIAVTDYVLVVGSRSDMKNNRYDSSLCELFYVPKGMTVECYASTLHYTPIAVKKSGFKTICLLLKGTGDPLVNGPKGMLKRKNKWFITHPENFEKVKAGDMVGLSGEMIKINALD